MPSRQLEKGRKEKRRKNVKKSWRLSRCLDRCIAQRCNAVMSEVYLVICVRDICTPLRKHQNDGTILSKIVFLARNARGSTCLRSRRNDRRFRWSALCTFHACTYAAWLKWYWWLTYSIQLMRNLYASQTIIERFDFLPGGFDRGRVKSGLRTTYLPGFFIRTYNTRG